MFVTNVIAQSLGGGAGGRSNTVSGGVGGTNSTTQAGGNGGVAVVSGMMMDNGAGGGGGAGNVSGGGQGGSITFGGTVTPGGAGGIGPGGNGAAGSYAYTSMSGTGSGGGGGASGATPIIPNTGTISGGNGGNGGVGGIWNAGSGGGGGAGGYGVIMTQITALTNQNGGTIRGGNGGNGGTGFNSYGYGGNGGSGGVGVFIGIDAAVLNNAGVIIGGNKGTGGSCSLWCIGGASGGISGSSAPGVYIASGYTAQITNAGSITGGTDSYGIWNAGTISTLNNAQGGNSGSAATTTMTYKGILPSSYNIIINSSTSFGQLAVTSITGNTSFGISSLSAGSSVVSGTAYTSVLSGITNTQLGTSGTTISGTSNNYTYTLSRKDAVNNIWDLIISGFSAGGGGSPSSSTYRSNTLAYLRSHAAGAAGMLDSLSASPAMSGVMTALNNLSGAAQANAIAQTLPAMTGAASQATAGAMQALNQVVQGRSNSLRGMSSGDEYIGNRDVWMKGFGSWANQNDVNGVSGYKVNTGGLAIGIDQGITPKMNIGAVFAFSNSSVSSNSGSAPSGVTVNSYQAGIYGDYAIDPKIIVNAQADIGLNNNKEYRNITFMGTNANGTYNSYSGHIGTGVKYLMPINPENTFIPSVRVDYTTVQSQAYSETGAGALNLSVGQQTYNTLIPSADMRIDHSLDSKLTLSANAGAGYNTLNNQVSATSAYAGGGTTFATNGLQVSPWLYNAGVGVTGQIDKNLQLNVRYDNVFSPTGYMNQMVSAKLKIPL